MKSLSFFTMLGLVLVSASGFEGESNPDSQGNALEWQEEQLLKRIADYSRKKIFVESVTRELGKALGAVAGKMKELKANGQLTQENRQALMVDFKAVEKKIAAQLDDPISSVKVGFCWRIENGIKSGKLTDQEAKNIQKDFDRICEKEERYRSDGNFTSGEQQTIERELESLSKKIWKEKSDSQRKRN